MSQPLSMSFRPDALDLCRAGVKTRTRRIWNPEWKMQTRPEDPTTVVCIVHEFMPKRNRIKWRVGDLVGLKRKRTGCVEERVLCVSLRAERVQDITEEEAIAEGMTPLADPAQCAPGAPPLYTDGHGVYATARAAFEATWRRLNRRGAIAWDANPLVVVIGLQPIRPLDTSRVEALVEKYTARARSNTKRGFCS